VVKSAHGDSYEISGAGSFDAQNKSVKAAGTFSHKLTNGNVLETGVWIVSDLISFTSYGTKPAALMQKGLALGGPKIGFKRTPTYPGPLPTGGLGIFRILLMPVSGKTETAVMEVNCALGDVPHERSVEGIRIRLERNNFEYLEEVSGRVMFLTLRPERPPTVPEQDVPEAPNTTQR
jgi:hypothetical protein